MKDLLLPTSAEASGSATTVGDFLPGPNAGGSRWRSVLCCGIFLLFLPRAPAGRAAAEPQQPAIVTVGPEIASNGILTISAANFSIAAPGPGWVWKTLPRAKPLHGDQSRVFYCESPGAGLRLSVVDLPVSDDYGLDDLTMREIGRATQQSYAGVGWTMSAFHHESSSSPLPGTYSMGYKLERPAFAPLYCFGRVLWTGHQVILQACVASAIVPPAFATFVGSVRTLAPAPRPTVKSSFLESPDPYLIVLALALAVASIINRFRRAAPLAIWRFAGYSVAATLVLAITLRTIQPHFQDLPIEDIAAHVGRMIGSTTLAFLIAVIGSTVSRRRALTRARKAAQKGRDTPAV